jgi:hypothetical protein
MEMAKREQEGGECSQAGEQQDIWKFIWKLKVPAMLKILLGKWEQICFLQRQTWSVDELVMIPAVLYASLLYRLLATSSGNALLLPQYGKNVADESRN